MTLRRYALTLEYDGAPFVGWQRQENGLSVQAVLEEAAARLNGGVVPLAVAAGRKVRRARQRKAARAVVRVVARPSADRSASG